MDDEAALIGEFSYDLNGDGGGVCDARAVVGAIGEGVFDERVSGRGLLEERHRAVAILHVGRVDEQFEHAPIGVDHGMTLATHHLLAGIVAPRPARLGGLDALAVDDGRRWARLATGTFPIDLDQMMVETFEYGGIAQLREPAVNRAPGREAVGEQPPRATGPKYVENCLDDPGASASAAAGRASAAQEGKARSSPTRHR